MVVMCMVEKIKIVRLGVLKLLLVKVCKDLKHPSDLVLSAHMIANLNVGYMKC